MASTDTLSPAQAHALFDILTHHETYTEIENFKSPNAVHEYGHPFRKADDVAPTSPLLHALFNKFALILPGLSSVAPKFWQDQCSTILEKLGSAELSESFERGTLGARKTVATAISAVLEYLARGVIGGFSRKLLRDPDHQYDTSKAADILAGWDEFTQRLVYADMADELFARSALTEDLEEHSSVVRAAHEFILVNLASFAHHILILSPDGPYLLKILENAHRLIPYALARQTLRVGNAATMINGMVRIVLAKLSVTAFTNWMGLSNNTDDGMNLVQSIISTVLRWDIAEFQKQATKIEKTKDSLTNEHIDALKGYTLKTRDEHEDYRKRSISKPTSIVSVIFTEAGFSQPVTEIQHSLAMEYLTKLLEIRDREELIKVLCRHNPDIFTQIVRDAVTAYDPIIRSLHNAVDLSGGLWDAECFLNDLIKLSKPNANGNGGEVGALPTVADYVELLRKHQGSCHRFLHQIAKNGPELSDRFRDWSHEALKQFKDADLETAAKGEPLSNQDSAGAGAVTDTLKTFVQDLSEKDQERVKHALDEHVKYLSELRDLSQSRLKSTIEDPSNAKSGPGMYLAKWQALLDNTPITPDKPDGPVRYGKDAAVRNASKRGPVDEDAKLGNQKTEAGIKARETMPQAPNVEVVTRLMAKQFRGYLAKGIK